MLAYARFDLLVEAIGSHFCIKNEVFHQIVDPIVDPMLNVHFFPPVLKFSCKCAVRIVRAVGVKSTICFAKQMVC